MSDFGGPKPQSAKTVLTYLRHEKHARLRERADRMTTLFAKRMAGRGYLVRDSLASVYSAEMFTALVETEPAETEPDLVASEEPVALGRVSDSRLSRLLENARAQASYFPDAPRYREAHDEQASILSELKQRRADSSHVRRALVQTQAQLRELESAPLIQIVAERLRRRFR